MKVYKLISLLVFMGFITTMWGCAELDTKVNALPGPGYKQYQPRGTAEDVIIFHEEPEREYEVIARYIIQETDSLVFIERTPEAMLKVLSKRAWKDGADAIIVDEFDTVDVGKSQRESPQIKVRGIRFTDGD